MSNWKTMGSRSGSGRYRNKAAPNQLAQWVEAELQARGRAGYAQTLSDAARQTGVSQPTFTRILGGAKPNAQTCLLLAPWLHKSEADVLRAAGRLSQLPEPAEPGEESALKRRLVDVFDQLPEIDQRRLIELAEWEAERQAERPGPQAELQTECEEAGGQ